MSTLPDKSETKNAKTVTSLNVLVPPDLSVYNFNMSFTVPLIILGVNIVLLLAAFVGVRYWIRRQPDALAAHYRLCSVVMWMGYFVLAMAIILCLVSPHVGPFLLPVGALIYTSMILKRKELLRRMTARRQANTDS
jgi:hypothetical protein